MTVAQGYIGRSPGEGRTIIQKQTTTVTAGVQTSFSMTAGYDLGYLEVYLNGTKQVDTLDYTADDGQNISFSISTPPVQGDTLEFVAYRNFNVSNVTGSNRDFQVGRNLDVTGNVTIGSSLTIASDLVVNGTYTYVNTEILDVEDKTVGIASTSSPSNTTADGAGIVVYGGSDGDKSLTWDKDKANWILVGGGVSIGTGCTIGSSTANVLEFSVDGAVNAKLNNYGALIVGDGVPGEAWGNDYKTVQFGTGALSGNPEAASAGSYWTNNAYFDAVNSRWEYIAGDEASRWAQGDGASVFSNAASGSANGAITWTERLRILSGGGVGIGDSIYHLGDDNTQIRFPAADTFSIETGGTERLRCDSDGVKVQNGRFYSAGTFAHIDTSSTSIASLTLKKTTGGADSIDYLQLRNNANDLKLKISGDGIIFSPDVLASHEGDTDTKIRFPGADQFSVETAGSQRLHIDTDGDALFSATGDNAQFTFKKADSPDGEETVFIDFNRNGTVIGGVGGAAQVSGASGGDMMLAAVNGNNLLLGTGTSGGATEALRIDSSQRLLIGTTASRSANSAQGSFQIEGTGAEDSDMSIIRNQANSGGPAIVLGKSRNASLAGNTVVQDGDQLGTIVFVGNDGTDLTSQGARIDAYVDGTPGSNDMPGRLVFSTTADGASSTTEALRITSGNVVRFYSPDGNSKGYIYQTNSDNFIVEADANDNIDGDLLLRAVADGGTIQMVCGGNNERLRIGSDGDVSVGTNNWPTGSMSRAAGRVVIGDAGDLTLWNETNSAGGGASFKLACKEGGDSSKIGFVQMFGGTENTSDQKGFLAIKISNATGSGIEALRITSAGDLLIGNTNGGAEAINLVGGGGGILISRSASSSPSDGQTLGDIGLNSYSSGQTCSSADVLIRGQADGAHSGSSAGSALLLFTKPASTGPGSAPTERLRINKDGNVGINDTSPDQLVSIKNTGDGECIKLEGSDGTKAFAVGSTNTHEGYLRLYNEGGGPQCQFAVNMLNWISTGSNYQFVVGSTAADGGVSAGRITLEFPANSTAGYKSRDTQSNGNAQHMVIISGSSIVGYIKSSTTNASFHTSSDYRLKENVVDLTDGITRLKQLKPRKFEWKSDSTNTLVDGFIAHEADGIIPDLVSGTKDAMMPILYKEGDTIPDGKQVGDKTGAYSTTQIEPQTIDYAKLTPLLTAALQEAIAKIEVLETKVAALESA